MKHLSALILTAAMLLVAPTSHAAPITYTANLSGPDASPPNASPGTGTVVVSLDTTSHVLEITVTFADLLGQTTFAHLHCCEPSQGVDIPATTEPTLAFFPAGITSGSFHIELDTTLLSTWNSDFITAHGGTVLGAETALAAGLADGEAYFNIRTTQVPAGEIRGFLVPVAVPEPATLTLLGATLAAIGLTRRRGGGANQARRL